MNQLVDSFVGSGQSLAVHVADSGQTYRGSCRVSGQVNGGVYGIGCCGGNYREARANAVIFDNLSHSLDFQRGTSALMFAGLIARAEAGGLGDETGRGFVAVWFRQVNAGVVEVGYVQRNNTNAIIQGNDAAASGLVQFAWAQNTWMRLRLRLQGDVLTAYRSDAFGSANEVQLFQVTLSTPFADAAHVYAGWFDLDYGGGAAVTNLLTKDEVPPTPVLLAAPSVLTFESYDEVAPPLQEIALTALNGPAKDITVETGGIPALAVAIVNLVEPPKVNTPCTLQVRPLIVGVGIDPGVYHPTLVVKAIGGVADLPIPVTVIVDTPWSDGRVDASASAWQAVP